MRLAVRSPMKTNPLKTFNWSQQKPDLAEKSQKYPSTPSISTIFRKIAENRVTCKKFSEGECVGSVVSANSASSGRNRVRRVVTHSHLWGNSMNRAFLFLTVAGLIISAPGPSLAETLNVEFGPPGISYTGIGAAPDTGTYWNYATAPHTYAAPAPLSTSNLVYSDGVTSASGIGITSSDLLSSFSNGVSLTDSRVFANIQPGGNASSPFSLTISGLSDSATYDLYLFGSYQGYSTLYSVGSVSDYAYGYLGDVAPFQHNIDYALLTNLTPTDGSLTIDLNYYGDSAIATISALQLATSTTQVPEPSSLIMLGGFAAVTGIGAAFRKRRQGRSTTAACVMGPGRWPELRDESVRAGLQNPVCLPSRTEGAAT